MVLYDLMAGRTRPHEGRIFFFATERSGASGVPAPARSPESERWVSAIRTATWSIEWTKMLGISSDFFLSLHFFKCNVQYLLQSVV